MEPIRRRRWWVAAAASASLIMSGFGALGAAQAAPDDASLAQKIDDQVETELQAEGRADVWVRLAEQADLTAASSIADWDARGQAVVDALQKTAESTQQGLRTQLDDQGVEYTAYWATNSIRIGGADADLVTSLAAEGAVEGIYPTMKIEVPEPVEEESQMSPTAVEWGVDDVNAPEVWNDLGIRGEGVVVANIDTGVQYDHPALVNQYRGNNGDGTFTHDYNWFDPTAGSPTPTDYNGHGTHTMGTMVGDDGGDNQVGVAPDARWIAAAGCCPTDQALVDSGQWMLNPTRIDGTDPDVSKRPNIINNSWGTQMPSNAPFMEDIIVAWQASGIFGVFANGNSGPACETSGAPGSRIVAYSVGNYNSSHAISGSSSKGAGQDGEIKPNISAPGSAVRSAVPGNGYATYSGTSMATPHVAGAVALAWSGAPALMHDVEGTRALLDGTAIDTEDLTCGGTAADNNVFGEGRLDALALLGAAPIGDTGTLSGTVSDATTGDPLSGVSVTVEGPISRNLVTNDEGAYTALLSTGDYDVTMSKFGYVTQQSTVTVTAGETTTVDATMDHAPSSTVSGTVTDGSGYGFPLYARVVVDGTPAATFTDPESGAYSIDLPQGETFTLTVQVQYPGYETPSTEVTVAGDQTLDVAVPVDADVCTAPGYNYQVDGVTESFDSTEAPVGWEVVDHAGTGQGWLFDNPRARDNMTGGEGNFAIMDSDYHGSGGVQDTSLVSPSVDMSTLTAPAVGFKQDWRSLGDDLADVDVSLDGGATWQTVLSQDGSVRGPDEQFIQLPMAAGQPDVKVRFHNHKVDWDWWWQVDDVFVGNRACVAAHEGAGYVVGTVSGVETGEGISGATVTNLDVPEETARTTETPADENLGDGFYWMFSTSPGTHPFEAQARQFETVTQDVTVEAGDAVRADFALGSGFVVVDPTALETTLSLGDGGTGTLTVSNTGSGAADVELSELAGDFVMQKADGTTSRMGTTGDAGEVITLDAPTSFEAVATGKAPAGALDPAFAPTEEWTPLANYPTVVMDGRVVNVDGEWYSIGGTNGSASYDSAFRYDAAAQSWTPIASLPASRSAVTAGNVDGNVVVSGGWVAGGTTSQTLVYDSAADAWTEVADNPVAVSAAGSAVVDGKLYSVGGCTSSACTPMSDAVTAYDAASDSWEQLADYPVAVAFPSCGGVDGQVVCTGGNPGSGGIADSYAFDPASGSWTALPDAPVDSWASQYAAANGQLVVNGGVQGGDITNATFAYDPAAGSWVTLPASGAALYRGGAACGIAKVGGSSGNFNAVDTAELLPGYDDCGASGADVTWMSLDQTAFTVPAGGSTTVTVTMDGDVAQPGTYTAGIRVRSNTPQKLDPIAVTMTVTPPSSWGKLTGTVTGVSCEGAPAPLPGTMVDVTPLRGAGSGIALITDKDGGYARWMTSDRGGHYGLITAKDGYRPQSQEAQVKRGRTTTVDFALQEAGC